MITTVTVTYADGSTKVLVATTNFSTSTVAANQTATLTYSYTFKDVPYTKTCTTQVTILPKTKICSNGHTYNLKPTESNPDGSLTPCPYCAAYLSNLKVINPATGSITVYRGTTLAANGVTLRATYMDGHTEDISSGYIENFDNTYVGTQTVTFTYKGLYATLSVTTKKNLMQCSVCSKYYELYPDDSDPGCPYCLSETPIFTKFLMKYYTDSYNSDIVKEIIEGSGTYYFSDNDYFEIQIYKTNNNWFDKISTMFISKSSSIELIYKGGGYVRKTGR